jgi:hypothetical protein
MLASKFQRSARGVPRRHSFKRAALVAFASVFAASCLLDPKSDDLPHIEDVSGITSPSGEQMLPPDNPSDSPPLTSGESNNPPASGFVDRDPEDNEGRADGADAGTATTLGTLPQQDAGAAATTLSTPGIDAGVSDGIDSSE